MNPDLTAFHEEFLQDVYTLADAAGTYVPDAFFDLFCAHLIDAGELETSDRAFVEERGVRIDGYGGDPVDSDNVLKLIVTDCQQTGEITTLTATEMNAIFKRATNFVTKARAKSYRDALEETSAAFGLADLVNTKWNKIAKIRFYLLTNRVLSARIDGRDADAIDSIPVTYSAWDIDRLFRFVDSGRGREDVELDLADYGGPIPAIHAAVGDAEYEAYLAVVPGSQLAQIYDRWGARLLEQNVRVFLQARGKVNKGIRNTIDNEPAMFFAYNNGITATADRVSVTETSRGLMLESLTNLQIVNGGQTTASVHAAAQRKADLSKVFVQMKLSVISPTTAEQVVPRISEFANSQNRVNAADFFSNHPFHVRMQEFSRRILAPSPDGGFRQTKWFYERARGQYQDQRGKLTGTARKQFELENPRSQRFSKTDMAKFLNVWRKLPHIVSGGAQKNFANFAAHIGKAWQKQPDHFNEAFFRELVAKAIIFRRTERIVSAQPWYDGGYRANVVAYALAKLALDVEVRNRAINFAAVWDAQDISDDFEALITLAAKAAHDVIVNPLAGISNVTEWAKKQGCWDRLSEVEVDWPKELLTITLTQTETASEQRAAVREQRELNGIEAQTLVVTAGGQFWRQVFGWARSRNLIGGKEAGILQTAAMIPTKVPSDRQSIIVVKTYRRLQQEGCPFTLPE